MNASRSNLRQHLLNEQRLNRVDQDLVLLIEDIATSCRIIAHQVRNGALLDTLGATDTSNVQGETQKQLDIIANDIFLEHCANCERVAALVSEEIDDVIWLKDDPKADGSSNLNVNLSVGSIFSIVALDADISEKTNDAVLIAGSRQICAGYALYGPSTSFVFTIGNGVDGFTHQLGTGEFRLTFPGIRLPRETSEFAINASRYRKWDTVIRQYVDECLDGTDGPRGRDFNMRWTASMVAEVHRILMRGGVFLYPKDSGNASVGGKLRLLYEANPMSFIIEQAGGRASTGAGRILDVHPTSHHQ
ncbi:UNVERIFIED_CONTAM: hypothetical protein GTU68_053445, partial [Idotea baltica]|nr:hypothetical protein [Idotea baltica]